MSVTREQIIKVARSWVGTPFMHQGRVKGKACDCVGLPVMVAKELGMQSRSKPSGELDDGGNYSLEPEGTVVLDAARRHLIEKPIKTLTPGDALVMRMPNRPCHMAIVGEYNGRPTLIHAYNRVKEQVVEHHLDDYWRTQIVACFRFPGVED